MIPVFGSVRRTEPQPARLDMICLVAEILADLLTSAVSVQVTAGGSQYYKSAEKTNIDTLHVAFCVRPCRTFRWISARRVTGAGLHQLEAAAFCGFV